MVFGQQIGSSEGKEVKSGLDPSGGLGKERKCGDSLWTTKGQLEKIPMHRKTSTICFPGLSRFSSRYELLLQGSSFDDMFGDLH